MQFVYIDESGLGNEPIGVMVGVIADSHRMRLTKQHWNELLEVLSKIIGRKIVEIHTRDLYSGNSPWRNLNGDQRSQIITAIFKWLTDRKHSIVYSAINKEKFNNEFVNDKEYKDVNTLWRFMALHLSLSLQKHFQGSPRNKKRTVNLTGNFVLVFDNEHKEEKRITDLLLNAPDWTDSYYNRLEHQDTFSQLVDVPHFVDSKDVGLIQLADFICFFLRKYIELQMDFVKEEYVGEKAKVKDWSVFYLKQSIPKNNIYLSRSRCNCAELFYKYAPSCIL
jgi:hypothetical protein